MAQIDSPSYFYEILKLVQSYDCCTYCGAVPGCKPAYVAYDPSTGGFWTLSGMKLYKVMCQKNMARHMSRGFDLKTIFVSVTETYEEFQARLVHIS